MLFRLLLLIHGFSRTQKLFMATDDKKQPLDGGAARATTIEIPSKRETKPLTVKKSNAKAKGKHKRTRVTRPYPASSFEEALKLAEAIQKIAPGGKVRRLTLCEQMKISPTSSSTLMLITNSGKYGITKGSYVADWLELTADGKLASGSDTPTRDKLKARFRLAIEGVKPFNALYEEHKGRKLPAHAVIKDFYSLPKLMWKTLMNVSIRSSLMQNFSGYCALSPGLKC